MPKVYTNKQHTDEALKPSEKLSRGPVALKTNTTMNKSSLGQSNQHQTHAIYFTCFHAAAD